MRDDTENTAAEAAPAWAPDLLIYVPALPRFPANTGEVVADVVAATLDIQRDGHYRAATSRATAPRALRVAKSVLGPDDKPVLDVLELDYRERMVQANATSAGAGAMPGAIASFGWSLRALLKLVAASRRKAKSKRAKLQLLLGVGATAALVLVTLGALAAQAGLLQWLPQGIKDLGTAEAEPAGVAGGAAGAYAAFWFAFRKKLRVVADHMRETMRYLHGDRHHDTVTRTLDEAIDGLLDSGWKGRIHVLGYSFGSLVAIDALLPPGTVPERADRIAATVETLTTVGCPADAVTLFYPDYVQGRASRKPALTWRNVFIPADVFGSNFAEKNDERPATAEQVLEQFAGVVPICCSYTTEKMSLLNILGAKGFRMHGGYWGAPTEDSCFTLLVDAWVPPQVVELDAVMPAQRTTSANPAKPKAKAAKGS